MNQNYEIEKWIWMESDFDVMGWHDSRIYGIALFPENGEIAFDIDNIRRKGEHKPHNAQYIGRESDWLWVIECQEGEIRFRSVGYEQFIRAAPQLRQEQTIDLK